MNIIKGIINLSLDGVFPNWVDTAFSQIFSCFQALFVSGESSTKSTSLSWSQV